MTLLSKSDALKIAHDAFPNGPEAIAKALRPSVVMSELDTRSGWCVVARNKIKIRINSREPIVRQRFTLAHELSHVILGTAPDMLASRERPFQSSNTEEREADEFASQMLLPVERVKAHLATETVDHLQLKKLAKEAKLSELMVACRLASVAPEIGIRNAAVVGFNAAGKCSWIWSQTLTLKSGNGFADLFTSTRDATKGVYRKPQTNGVLTAFQLGSPEYPAVFVQLLPPEVAEQKTPEEVVQELRKFLFQGNTKWEQRMSGYIGSFKPSVNNLNVESAIQSFLVHYKEKISTVINAAFFLRLSGKKGRQFLALRLKGQMPT